MDTGLLLTILIVLVAVLAAKLRPKGYPTNKSVIQEVTPYIANRHFTQITYGDRNIHPGMSDLELVSHHLTVNYWRTTNSDGVDEERITIKPHNNAFFLELIFIDGKVFEAHQNYRILELSTNDNYNVHKIAQAVRDCRNA